MVSRQRVAAPKKQQPVKSGHWLPIARQTFSNLSIIFFYCLWQSIVHPSITFYPAVV